VGIPVGSDARDEDAGDDVPIVLRVDSHDLGQRVGCGGDVEPAELVEERFGEGRH
jgi:hypothetical protein